MHIRSLITCALMAMACLAFAPAAYAAPLTIDHAVCAIELAPAHVDYALTASAPSCDAIAIKAEAIVFGPGDDDDVAAGRCSTLAHATFMPSGARLHFDPGRIAV